MTAAALGAVLLASTASSIAGFAFSALCGALLFHLMESHVDAVQVMLICSITIQLFSVAALWRSIDWRSLPIFLIGGVLGVPAGVYLLLHLPTGTYRDAIGGLLIAYGGYLVLRLPIRSLRRGRLADACAGFLGGLTGGLAAFPGAFVTIWCGFKDWDKARQRGVYQPFILGMQLVTLVAIYIMRPTSPPRPRTWREALSHGGGCQLQFLWRGVVPAKDSASMASIRVLIESASRSYAVRRAAGQLAARFASPKMARAGAPLATILTALERDARPVGIPAERGTDWSENLLPTREVVRGPPSIHSLYLLGVRPGRGFSRGHSRGSDNRRHKPNCSSPYPFQ